MIHKWELPGVQAGFRKGRGTRDQIANICWITQKAREFQKNIYFCFIDYTKVFDCVYHNKLWKIHQEMGIPDHLTCLLRNLYAGQEATVRTGHGTTDWFQRSTYTNIHWKNWCWSWNCNTLATWCKELTHWKRPWCWARLRQEEWGMTEDEMVGWHRQLDEHKFEQVPRVRDGQESLVCCSPWGRKESDTTERLDWTEYSSSGGGHGNPLQYSCLENPHGPGSLAGYSPWGFIESEQDWATELNWQLIDNVVFISGIHQGKSVIHIHIFTVFRFFAHIGHYRVWSKVPCAM